MPKFEVLTREVWLDTVTVEAESEAEVRELFEKGGIKTECERAMYMESVRALGNGRTHWTNAYREVYGIDAVVKVE